MSYYQQQTEALACACMRLHADTAPTEIPLKNNPEGGRGTCETLVLIITVFIFVFIPTSPGCLFSSTASLCLHQAQDVACGAASCINRSSSSSIRNTIAAQEMQQQQKQHKKCNSNAASENLLPAAEL